MSSRALRLITILCISIATFFQSNAADNDSTTIMLRSFVNRALSFAERMPREKVYVHLDNTGYFKGDKIWFQCYVVNGIDNSPTLLSHTLYVELLNPRGVVVSRQILRIDNGRCHGSFTLSHLPFYSGFYEIRAFTKYMLNFGDAAVFSRTIPVFDPPQKDGDLNRWHMSQGIARYPGKRPPTKSGSGVSMRFFPGRRSTYCRRAGKGCI